METNYCSYYISFMNTNLGSQFINLCNFNHFQTHLDQSEFRLFSKFFGHINRIIIEINSFCTKIGRSYCFNFKNSKFNTKIIILSEKLIKKWHNFFSFIFDNISESGNIKKEDTDTILLFFHSNESLLHSILDKFGYQDRKKFIIFFLIFTNFFLRDKFIF